MIDPIVSLAFAMHSSPGVYALLLGSGVSIAAGVPTGWDITLDLIRRVAALEGEDCEPAPDVWFTQKYGIQPDYSKLLKILAPTAHERNRLLKSYFEPTEAEREEGKKLPAQAHKAIANLISAGVIRVIITTNFDHLIEQALQEEGITPTVISTANAAKGVIPLTHGGCFVIKLHGDYLDARFKNTPEELGKIGKPMQILLDRVFDEFGLVVCGWSAVWDTGLREIIERCKSHRFTTYWTNRGKLDEKAEGLITLRRAQKIDIRDADSFFSDLAEKVTSLKEFARPHPLSTKAAVVSLKKYIVDESSYIRLRDLVNETTEALHHELMDNSFHLNDVPNKEDDLRTRVARYEALSERLLSLMIAGCYWGRTTHHSLWTKSLERIANSAEEESGLVRWQKLRLYPALFLIYGGGIAAIANDNYENLKSLLVDTKLRRLDRDHPLISRLTCYAVFTEGTEKQLPGMDEHRVPVSDYLFNILREPLREYIPDDKIYERHFDRFEYLSSLVFFDVTKSKETYIWPYIGSFGWRYLRVGADGYSIQREIESEFVKNPEGWPLKRLRLFNKSPERFSQLKEEFDSFVSEQTKSWW